MGLIRELKDFVRFFWSTPTVEKQIVFYAEHEGYYVTFEGLVDELNRKGASPFCYVTSEEKDPILQKRRSEIHTFFFNQLLPFFMLFVKCKAFVLTMPELNIYTYKRSLFNVHYIYVFHAAISANVIYGFGAFEHYDSVLCVGPHQKAELAKQEELYGWHKKELIEAGYYRIERIYNRYRDYIESEDEAQKDKGKVLFAPSWEASNVVQTYAVNLVQSLRASEYQVIMRLHPETIRRFPEWVSSFRKEFEEDDGVVFEGSVSSDESMIQAIAIITDWSGIAPEYAYGTERPVIYLDIPQKVVNEQFTELELEPNEVSIRKGFGIIVLPEEIPNMATYIKQAVSEREKFREKIIGMRNANLFHFGKSSKIGAEHILDVVKTHKVN